MKRELTFDFFAGGGSTGFFSFWGERVEPFERLKVVVALELGFVGLVVPPVLVP